MNIQWLSLLGAFLILLAYAGAALGRLPTDTARSAALNFLGAGLLGIVAVVERQIGFIILEGVWTIVSLVTLIRRLRPT